MITLTREEAQELLNALTMFCRPNEDQVDELVYEGAIELLSARLSAPEPEPVACKHSGSIMTREQAVEHCRRRRPGIEPTEKHIAATIDAYSALFGDLIPADTAPPQREWQSLTDEEKDDLYWKYDDVFDAIVATEAKLREKNA